MKRKRMTNAKLFIKKPGGEWEEVKGVQIGPFAYQLEPRGSTQGGPVEVPALRDFSVSIPFPVLHLLDVPPVGGDPREN